MYSKSALLLKPKLTVIETYNKFIMNSYKKISTKLEKNIIKYEDYPIKYKIFKNIKFICEIAIPFVSFYVFISNIFIIRIYFNFFDNFQKSYIFIF